MGGGSGENLKLEYLGEQIEDPAMCLSGKVPVPVPVPVHILFPSFQLTLAEHNTFTSLCFDCIKFSFDCLTGLVVSIV